MGELADDWRDHPVGDFITEGKLANLRACYPDHEIATLKDIAAFSEAQLLRVPALGRKTLNAFLDAICLSEDPTAYDCELLRSRRRLAENSAEIDAAIAAREENDRRMARAIWDQRRDFHQRRHGMDIGEYTDELADKNGLVAEARAALAAYHQRRK